MCAGSTAAFHFGSTTSVGPEKPSWAMSDSWPASGVTMNSPSLRPLGMIWRLITSGAPPSFTRAASPAKPTAQVE